MDLTHHHRRLRPNHETLRRHFDSQDSDHSALSNANCYSRKRKSEFENEEQVKEEKSEVTMKADKHGSSCKNDFKVCDADKKDYIHVRARRGQATDSHSLAERARREKISKKMKCLQDLVPGCNKVTGKAGMLDEIINYVQSLQKQVEILSMKLAALNPTLDLNVDNFFAKEMIKSSAYAGCVLPPSAEPTNSSCYHYNLMQQSGSTNSLPEHSSQKSAISEALLESSYMQQLLGWEIDWQI